MRRLVLRWILVVVPLAVVPWAVTFDALKALFLALGALVLLGLALRRPDDEVEGRLALRWSPASAAMALTWLALAVASVGADDPWAAGRRLAVLLAAMLVAFAVENVVEDPEELRPFTGTITTVAVLTTLYGLLQTAGWDLPFPWAEERPGIPVSTYGNPNFAAETIAMAVPFAILGFVRARGAARIGAGAGLLLLASFPFIARSRAAVAGLVLGLIAAGVLILVTREGRARVAGLALGGALLLGLAGAGFGLVTGGLEPPAWIGRSDTVSIRADLAAGTLDLAATRPLGVGAGNWEAAFPPHRREREARLSLFRDPGEAHNEPLQFAAEAGWVGALLGLGWLVLLARAALRAARGRDRGFALALAASAATALATGLASSPLHRPASLTWFAFVAGALALLGGGRVWTPGRIGAIGLRTIVVLAGAGSLLLAGEAMGEGPRSEARRLLHAADPLPPELAEEAIGLFESGLARDPGAVDAAARAGVTAFHLAVGRTDPDFRRSGLERAAGHLDHALALRPLDPTLLHDRALVHAAAGENDAARSAWARALAVQPWHRAANHGLGFHLLRTGSPADGLAHLDAALATDPLYAPAIGARVEALAVLGRDDEALVAASEGLDSLLASDRRSGSRTRLVAGRGAAASLAVTLMLLRKGERLLTGPDPDGGRWILEGVVASRGDETVLDQAAAAFEAADLRMEGARLRVRARFAAAEAHLAAGRTAAGAEEARRALRIERPVAEHRVIRVAAAAVLARAGYRAEALGELAVAVARGLDDPAPLLGNPAFDDLRDEPSFAALLATVRERAEK